MTRGLPSPTERPDLYDGFDGIERPVGWTNPIRTPERLRTPMNPIPLKTETFTPIDHRTDAHALRYEFRHLVNAGVVTLDRYEAFVAFVDASGGVSQAIARLRDGAPLV